MNIQDAAAKHAATNIIVWIVLGFLAIAIAIFLSSQFKGAGSLLADNPVIWLCVPITTVVVGLIGTAITGNVLPSLIVGAILGLAGAIGLAAGG